MTDPPLEHDEYDLIEEELNDALAVSLSPRSHAVLFDVIAGLPLDVGATVVDVGCGEGSQSLELATRFGFDVLGIDPLEARMRNARTAAASTDGRIRFERGTAEAIPMEDAHADLVLCRELLYVVDDLVTVLRECHRVLRPGGFVVVYQLFSTELLEPREAAWFWGGEESARRNTPEFFESAAAEADLVIADMIDLGSETVEAAEEASGKAGSELLAAARLRRDPERYIARFGRAAYDIKLNDAFWFIYRMIGKLTQRVYVLSRQ